jgi:putative ABC transport system permease protein
MDPNLVLHHVRSIHDVMGEAIARERFTLALLAAFAAIAVSLAAVGIYGVLAQGVKQRSGEIGIRMALGASAGRVRRTVVGHGALLAAVGITVGLLGAHWLARLMESMLFEVSATDPTVFISVPLLLGFVALLSAYLPARRVTSLKAVDALRLE